MYPVWIIYWDHVQSSLEVVFLVSTSEKLTTMRISHVMMHVYCITYHSDQVYIYL